MTFTAETAKMFRRRSPESRRKPKVARPRHAFVQALEERTMLFGAPPGQFVAAAYDDLLERPADTGGLDAWSKAVSQGLSREQLAAAFLQSPEANARKVIGAFQQFLGRLPDVVGARFWAGELARGLRTDQLELELLASREYFVNAGGQNGGFIQRLYQNLLGRPADVAGASHWNAVLASQNRSTVAEAVLASGEYRARSIDEWYRQLLDRPVDAGGNAFWSEQLARGATYEEVQARLAGSGEYFANNSFAGLKLPDNGDEPVDVTFSWGGLTSFRNEVGLYAADDAAGRVNGLLPGDTGYAAAALSSASRRVIYASGQVPPTGGAGAPAFAGRTVLSLPEGAFVGLYLVQNHSSAEFLQFNPNNDLAKAPRAFFSIAAANRDGFDHVRYEGFNRFRFEDQTNGGDRDFNDAIGEFTVTVATNPPKNEPPRLAGIADQLLDEETALRVVATAVDPDGPASLLRYSLDPASVARGASIDALSGAIAWTPTEAQGPGDFPITVRVADGATLPGTDQITFRAVVREVNRPPVLDAIADLNGIVGEPLAVQARAIDPDLPANGLTFSLDAASLALGAAIDPATGRLSFTPAAGQAEQSLAFTVRVTDDGQPSLSDEKSFSVFVHGCDVDPADGWTGSQAGGSQAGQGGVAFGSHMAALREGDSFRVALERTFVIPSDQAVLHFSLEPPTFDTTAVGQTLDAFEAALLDANDQPLVVSIGPGRDGFFNLSEGQPAALASGVAFDGKNVTLDIGHLAAGTSARLVLRLLNNDGDMNTQVVVDCAEMLAQGGGQGGLARFAASSALDQPPADPAKLADVSTAVRPVFSQTSYDEDASVLHSRLALRNAGAYPVGGPLLLALRLSDPTVRLRGADGVTADGLPFIDISRFVAGGSLLPGQATGEFEFQFFNPGRTPFTVDLLSLGQLNRTPEFTSESVVEVLAGKPYAYDADARDADGDSLSFSLVAAPVGMTLEGATGLLAFAPAASEIGSHAISIRVSDGRGGSAVQSFTLAVEENIPNRPPVIVSASRVDARVGAEYGYQALAVDPDGDSMQFSLLQAPAGMSIDQATGAISWTAAANQLGASAVEVSVTDGRGGTAAQSYSIAVATGANNHAPLILSDPITTLAADENALGQGALVNLGAFSVVDFDRTGPFLDNGPGQWTLSNSNTVAVQERGGSPTVLMSDFDLVNDRIDGTFRVDTQGNNSVGFVFGFQDLRHFYLFDWSRTPDNVSIPGGMSVNVVNSNVPLDGNDVTIPAGLSSQGRGATLFRNRLPWQPFVDYQFSLKFRAGEFTITITEGENVLATIALRDDTYALGKFGFYTRAQDAASFSGFRREALLAHEYDVQALDPDNDALTFSLVAAPPHATIDPQDGLIRFVGAAGQHAFQVRVDDGRGGVDTQSYTLDVSPLGVAQIRGEKFQDTDGDGTNVFGRQTIAGITVPGTADPWLAGTPDGSTASLQDVAPEQSPVLVQGITLIPGMQLSFLTTGGVSHQPGNPGQLPPQRPDGAAPQAHSGPAENGIAGLRAPIESLVGVFLSDEQPSLTSAPGALDYIPNPFQTNVPGTIDFTSFAPLLKQPFFIGDGRTSAGKEQTFHVPAGATRLFLGSMDGFGWLNNIGEFQVRVDSFFPEPRLKDFTIYLDANNNGSRDANERFTTTAQDGSYLFKDLRPGTFIVREEPQLGWEQVAPAGVPFGIHSVQLAAGEVRRDVDFGNRRIPGATAEIHGVKFLDSDGDGDRGPENGLPGFVIYLDQNDNEFRDAREFFARTDTQGQYAFTDLVPGQYIVREEQQSGFEQTGPATGAHRILLGDAEIVRDVNFGNRPDSTAGANRSPRFDSTPPTLATVGRLLRYDILASDADGDPLAFDLPVKPDGMAIEPNQGILVWRPTADQVGPQSVIVRVRDGRGGVTLQAFDVTVARGNSAPVITSTPPGPATADAPFVYTVRAQDAEGDALAFRLATSVDGITIDAASGLVLWTPRADQAGGHDLTVVVRDSQGAEDSQSFSLVVLAAGANRSPVMASTPRTQTGLAHAYLYVVAASDADGDPLSFTLDRAPAGMTIDARGVVSWQPNSQQLGDHLVRIVVNDGRGGLAEQSYTVRVTSAPSNRAPVFTSTPPDSATTGSLLAYDVIVIDPDGDVLFWSLDQAPDGVSVDAELGKLRWRPTPDQVGRLRISLRVTDSLGATALQEFDVDVQGVNTPPVLTSAPVTLAATGKPYRYEMKAFDLDGDRLSFALSTFPVGMTIDAQTGRIDWIPAQDQAGLHDVVAIVSDGRGGQTRQAYSIDARLFVNRPPVIASTPPVAGAVGSQFTYQVLASDPDGDAVSFELTQAPAGMSVTPSGLVQWVPEPGQQGNPQVTIEARDANSAKASQTFSIDVIANNRVPVLTGPPVQSVQAGGLYRFDIQASEPDGDPLSFRLDQKPNGMAVDTLGRITWQTTLADIGKHDVLVTIADHRGGEIELFCDIVVGLDQSAPKVQLLVDRNPVALGDEVRFLARAVDDLGVQTLMLTVGGAAVALDRNGRGALRMSQAGLFDAVATATDGAGNAAESRISLQVFDPSDVNPPRVDITSPADDAVVTTFTDIIGSVEDDNLQFYTLSIAPADGSGEFKEIARGTTPVTNGLLGVFDPTLLENDSYVLRLQAVDGGRNVSTVERTISIDGKLKLGNFRIAFTDIAAPVIGVPITVTRTYDSLAANRNGDVGFGWTLEVASVDFRTSVPGTGDEAQGIFSSFRDQTRVTLRLPDGTRQGFTFEPRLRFNLFGLKLFRPEFTPDPGVTSKLTVDQFDLQRFSDGTYAGMAAGGLAYNPADSAFGGKYTLTTQDGMVFTINGLSGTLERVTDRNGNTLNYLENGIFSSTGVSVTFERDAQGRITSAIDPEGKAVRYAYDANGDLVSFTDREGNVTRFTYDASQLHFLKQVIDPLGRTGARTEYGADGRLAALVDALGARVAISYDSANDLQIIVDALGNPTTFEYDSRGNVVQQIDALGGVIRRSYDTSNFLLAETDPLGRTTTYSYDTRGNALAIANGAGDISRFTYDSFGNVLSQTDPLGNTFVSLYDANGNLTAIVDPLGNRGTTVVDATGMPSSATDLAGNTTTYTFCTCGAPLSIVDALGHLTKFTRDELGRELSRTVFVTVSGGLQARTTTTAHDREGRVTSVTDADGNVTRSEYDALGRRTAIVDAHGHRTETVFDAAGRDIATRFADGTTESRTYNAAGWLESTTDRGGRQTRFEYDSLGRRTATLFPDGTPGDPTDNPRQRTEYDAAGQVVAEIDAQGNRWEFEYDAASRQILVRDALGGASRTEYDGAGRVVTRTDPTGATTRFVFDARGLQVQTVLANGATVESSFDAMARLVSLKEAGGAVTRREYDPTGRLAAVVDALGGRTTFLYDEVGSLVAETGASGRVTRREYDRLGRETAIMRPSGVRATQSYDSVGNVVERTDFSGQTSRFEYDSMHRPISRRLADGSVREFTYTPDGLMASTVDSRGVTTYSYDERNRLLSRVDPDGARIDYAYDAVGNRTALRTAAGTTFFAFDALNRLATVTDAAIGVTQYAYDAASRLVRTELPNGTTETRRYDEPGRLVMLEQVGSTGLIASFQYTLDADGYRTGVVELNGRTVDFEYDALHRLTREAITDSIFGNRTMDYAYDATGNRLRLEDSIDGLTEYAYDVDDRLITEMRAGQVTSYHYDDNGNLVSRFRDVADSAFYDWDAENRLIAADVTNDSGTQRLTYVYDPFGNRVASTVNGAPTRHLIDTNRDLPQSIGELTPTGETVRYVYGLGLIGQQRAAAVSFFQGDAIATTRALTDAAGAVTDRYVFDAFGRELGRVGQTPNSHLYAGQHRDGRLGLDYLRARYLDPRTGRFASVDPFDGLLGMPVSRHDYLYANGTPVNASDPTGEFTLLELFSVEGIKNVLHTFRTFSGISFACKVAMFAKEVPLVIGLVQFAFGFASAVSSHGFAPGLTVEFKNPGLLKPDDLEELKLEITNGGLGAVGGPGGTAGITIKLGAKWANGLGVNLSLPIGSENGIAEGFTAAADLPSIKLFEKSICGIPALQLDLASAIKASIGNASFLKLEVGLDLSVFGIGALSQALYEAPPLRVKVFESYTNPKLANTPAGFFM